MSDNSIEIKEYEEDDILDQKKESCCRKIYTKYLHIGKFSIITFILGLLVLGTGLFFELSDRYNMQSYLYFSALILISFCITDILEAILFGLFDFIALTKEMGQIIYFINSFQGYIGYFVAYIFIYKLYPNITGLIQYDTLDNLLLFICVLIISMGCHTLFIRIIMYSRLLHIFYETTDNMIFLKQIVKRLSNYSENKEPIIDTISSENKRDISWEIAKIKNNGFHVWHYNKHTNKYEIVEIYTFNRFKCVMDQIWKRKFDNNQYITFDDFVKHINIERNHHLFNYLASILDVNGDTRIKKQEYDIGVKHIYNQWKYFNNTLSRQNSVSRAVKVLTSIFFWFIMLIIALEIFDIPSQTVLVPMLTLIVSISFAVGPIISRFISSLIFVIFMYPYEVGDKISIKNVNNGNTLLVKEINILKTQFIESISGRLIIVPNYELMNYAIENFKRSKSVNFSFTFSLPHTVTINQINKFQKMLKNYIINTPNEWKPFIDLYIPQIKYSNNKIDINVWVYHQSSWMDGKIWTSNTNFMKHSLHCLSKLGIEYKNLDQCVTLKNNKIE
jgi:small-conductance mechanosensitive channel